jgi:hypothetical protein
MSLKLSTERFLFDFAMASTKEMVRDKFKILEDHAF